MYLLYIFFPLAEWSTAHRPISRHHVHVFSPMRRLSRTIGEKRRIGMLCELKIHHPTRHMLGGGPPPKTGNLIEVCSNPQDNEERSRLWGAECRRSFCSPRHIAPGARGSWRADACSAPARCIFSLGCSANAVWRHEPPEYSLEKMAVLVTRPALFSLFFFTMIAAAMRDAGDIVSCTNLLCSTVIHNAMILSKRTMRCMMKI